MKDIKDNFSNQAKAYAQFRPSYPSELFDFIYSRCNRFDKAWDCATGNGQAAIELAKRFEEVSATDISERQISLAEKAHNIDYRICPAHNTPFADDTFDLITVAQALHWFAIDEFYNEVKRVAKSGAFFAAWGYSLMRCNDEIDAIVDEFYTNVIGPYWDAERKHVDDEYSSLPFPFDEVECPTFHIKYNRSYEDLIGYFNSWSSVQHYINQKGTNPVQLIAEPLKHAIGSNIVEVTFPIFMRGGYVK
ncbi:MAG: class I SAM-dependent methyltransferase [Chitinophagales bacterium]|nr:class I SAM-dependent methyltransferase [Chitinophagaceae bacterium]MCB9065698.1 class I SAM-dependent methyltransferase [Chitinophagales bacterium]